MPIDGGARPRARRQHRQRRAGDARDRQRVAAGAPAAARQPASSSRSARPVRAAPLPRGPRAAAAAASRRRTSRSCCSTSPSTSRWRCCSSASPGCVGAHGRRAGCREPAAGAARAGRATSTRSRWRRRRSRSRARRARRCTRPTSSRRCCAASLPVIRNNDLRAVGGAAQARRHRRRALFGDQVLPDADLARGAVEGREPALDRHRLASRSTWSRSATSSSACCRTSRTRRSSKNRSFSDAGMAEIVDLHERLLSNLRLGMSVFLDGHVRDAKQLLEEKARFRDLEHEYAATHIARLREQHRAEHRDQLAAPRPDQRPEAHQLAHLLDRLPDPRVGRRADGDPDPPIAIRGARHRGRQRALKAAAC